MSERPFLQRPALDLIATGRTILRSIASQIDFDAPSWDLSFLRTRATGVSSVAYWTRYGTLDEPLPRHFIDPIKAVVSMNLRSVTNAKIKADAARFLWKSLEDRGVAERFRWETASTQDMLEMERTMRQHVAPSTTYKYCSAFSAVLEALANAGVTPPMRVRWATPRPEDSERYTLDGQEARMEKLPSAEALSALAEMYRSVTDEADCLVLCAAALMIASGGLRVGEVLTLPRNCIFYIGNGARESPRRFGLRFWLEKGGDERDLATRWIPRSAARLAVSAVRKVRRITNDAAARAKAIVSAELSGGPFPLPSTLESQPDNRLTCAGVAQAMGINTTGAATLLNQYGIRSAIIADGKAVEYYVDTEDLRRYLAGRQGDTISVRSQGVIRQRLDSALFVVFENQMHRRKRRINPLIVRPVTIQMINDALGGRWASADPDHPDAVELNGKWMRPAVRSLFDRYGYVELDGSPIILTTHQIRHWATTLASAGQAEDAVIARWQNRRNRAEVNAYVHLTTAERVERLRRALESGLVQGELAEVYFNLAENVRDAFLEAQIQHVHVTDVGLCVHDFSVSPCPYHLNCLKGCGDFLTDRSDPVQRDQLIQLEIRTKQVLEEEIRQASERGEELARAWIEEHELVLAHLRKINSSNARTVFRPFEGSTSRFQPIEDR